MAFKNKEQKEKSLNRHIDKTDVLYKEAWDNLLIGPEPDEYGMVKMNYQDFRKFVANRTNLAYCQGVYRTLAYFD